MTETKPEPPRHVTLDLIRKRSEHNERLVSNLEEIALHQEELQAIGPVLPSACGSSLRILLLQNNVISRLDPKEMKFFKQLEYLNLALNNIQVVEGIGHLEFLNKLDLTLNFISIDRLEESLECLSQMRSLRELFLMGNPCMNPERGGFDKERGRMYVIAKLPLLEFLDGEAITRSQRLKARQRIVDLEQQLQRLAMMYRESLKNIVKFQRKDRAGEKELTSHCPEDRVKMSDELAKQKAEKDQNERANQPKFKNEKEIEQDQLQAVEKARKREEKGEIKQCNEGRWKFWFDEEKKPGHLILGVGVQKHLSSSLIDVDVHPTFVSIVIKSKVLRVKLPIEVKAGKCTAQRITTTGHLMITMPKCDDSKPVLTSQARDSTLSNKNIVDTPTPSCSRRKCLQQELVLDAMENLTGTVRLQGIVKSNDATEDECIGLNKVRIDMVEKSTKQKSHNCEVVTIESCRNVTMCKNGGEEEEDDDDDDLPPPLL